MEGGDFVSSRLLARLRVRPSLTIVLGGEAVAEESDELVDSAASDVGVGVWAGFLGLSPALDLDLRSLAVLSFFGGPIRDPCSTLVTLHFLRVNVPDRARLKWVDGYSERQMPTVVSRSPF